MSDTGAPPAAPAPLAGLRVVELGQVLAGPFAGLILADLGADVLKVEKPEGGDDARQMGLAYQGGDALIFHAFNRGKRSIVLDLKREDGRRALDRLLSGADVFLHNMRAGVVESLGFGAEDALARHPRLIHCSLSAFGHRGPNAMRPGYEPLLQAYCGLNAITGEPGGPPVRMGASVVDQGTGMWAVIGILAALSERARTGRGRAVQASLFETATMWAGQKIESWVNEGAPPVRMAAGHPGFVPYDSYDAADAKLLICCGNDRLFAKLCGVLGRQDWLADPRFATNRARLVNRAALEAELVPALRSRPRAEWLAALEAAGVPCAPINRIEELVEDPHFQATGQLLTPPGEPGPKLVGLPLSFNGDRVPLRGPAPKLPR